MKLKTLFAGAALLAAPFAAAFAYPKANIHNRVPYAGQMIVRYAACKSDVFHIGASRLDKTGKLFEAINEAPSTRGGCLITSIEANLNIPGGKKVTSYSSSGTAYSNFIIAPTGTDIRVYSYDELVKVESASHEGKSPGFAITNNTIWPVAVALEQVGCLYYGTLKPGQTFNRNTGAVWFTIKANIQADGKEPRTDWDCVKPVAAVVGAVLVSAATAGVAAFAALPASGAAAAALAPIATSSAVIIGSAAGGAGLVTAGTGLAVAVRRALEANGGASISGQYAGGDWPFRCDQKPTYSITGGWGKPGFKIVGKDTSYAVDPGTPMVIQKTNTCGNSLMM
jgi:hypothetical protein